MNDKPDHLTEQITERGIAHLPALRGKGLGRVQVWESSSATEPCIWITAEDGGPQGIAHLPVAVARQLAEQLLYLCDNHYQLDRSDPPP